MKGTPRTWPAKTDDAPTAEQIARAFVAAARAVGDAERLAAAVGGGAESYRSLITRARWVALEALNLLWPKPGLALLAEKLGGKPDSVWGSLSAARKAPWWNYTLVDQVVEKI